MQYSVSPVDENDSESTVPIAHRIFLIWPPETFTSSQIKKVLKEKTLVYDIEVNAKIKIYLKDKHQPF